MSPSYVGRAPFHEDGPTSAPCTPRNSPRDRERRLHGIGGGSRAELRLPGPWIVSGRRRRRRWRRRRGDRTEIDTQRGQRTAERTAKEGSLRRDRRIRQSNGGFSTDDKDTRQRSPTLYFALNDQGTSTAESGGLRPPVGF